MRIVTGVYRAKFFVKLALSIMLVQYSAHGMLPARLSAMRVMATRVTDRATGRILVRHAGTARSETIGRGADTILSRMNALKYTAIFGTVGATAYTAGVAFKQGRLDPYLNWFDKLTLKQFELNIDTILKRCSSWGPLCMPVAQFTINHFNQLKKKTIRKVIALCPKIAPLLLRSVLDTFDNLLDSTDGQLLLRDIVRLHASASEVIIAHKLNSLLDTQSGQRFFAYLMRHGKFFLDKERSKTIICQMIESGGVKDISFILSLAEKDLVALLQYTASTDILRQCFHDDPISMISVFARTLAHPDILYSIINSTTCQEVLKSLIHDPVISRAVVGNGKKFSRKIRELLEDAVTRERDGNPFIYCRMIAFYKGLFGMYQTRPLLEDLTSTELHLVAHMEDVLREKCNRRFRDDPALNLFLRNLIESERKFRKRGYVTFVTGQWSGYLFAQQLDTDLWAVKRGVYVSDYIFPYAIKQLPEFSTQEEERRRMLKETTEEDRFDVIFMNDAIFRNSTRRRSLTPLYILKNKSAHKRPISVENIFAFHGLQKICAPYKEKFIELERRLRQELNYGTMLLIAIPKDHVPSYVYLSKPRAPHNVAYSKGERITNTLEILAALRNETLHDPDKKQFCMILRSLAMDPQGGMKVIPHVVAKDGANFLAIVFEYKELIDQIKRDIEVLRESGKLEDSLIN